ncbi:MAG: hypothetical protein U1F83_13745 [Verrucomicrobiota bacterium]
MKILRIISLLIVASSLSCSRPDRELASSALAKDFDGIWTWSGDTTNSVKVEVTGSTVKVTELPIVKGPLTGALTFVSTVGTAVFEPAYGAKGAPGILLTFPGIQEVVVLFITKDKAHLVYSVSEDRDWRITFMRTSSN